MPEPPQRELFSADPASPDAIAINARCLVRTQNGLRVVLVTSIPIAHYAIGDAMAEAYAMVSLIEQGWADQIDVATWRRCLDARTAACAATSVGSRTADWPRLRLPGRVPVGPPAYGPRANAARQPAARRGQELAADRRGGRRLGEGDSQDLVMFEENDRGSHQPGHAQRKCMLRHFSTRRDHGPPRQSRWRSL